MFLKKMPPGAGSRWAIGTAILIHLAIYNESGGPTALISVVIAAFSATLAAFNKSSLSHVQMPYIRATQKMDFFCLFLALWMDILALLAACGALARTLSTCLDAMTGGMARIYLLGRNSPENEPWPDVLGVSVVFLLTIMFMLGLENNKIFGLLMSTGVVGMTLILISSSIVRGRLDEWKNSNNIFPKGVFGVLSCAAISTFAFPSELTSTGNYKKLKGLVVVLLVWLFIVLTACCLSTITQFSDKRPFIAVPLFSILDSQDFHKVAPAIACLLVLTCSGAYLELFPEMYNLIVKLTTPEYKILAKQIGFENNDSGSPILAIFIGGSLCAMLAFACPLENLVYILSASHLCSTILRSFYLLYSPFKPKYMESNTSNEASLAYSRLDVSSNPSTSGRRSIWCFNKPKTLSISTSKSRLKKTKHDEELEREWLLLGEPQSPRVTVLEPDAESSILSDQPVSDIECIDRQIITESDSSTDIDAIVDEYRQKIKISTAGPMEKIVRIPTVGSWRMSLCLMVFIVIGILLALCGTIFHSIVLIICGVVDTILFSGAMLLLPKHTIHSASPSALFCGMALIIGSILLGSTLAYSWPAIIFWIFAGLTLYIRCDKWCCQCFERPRSQRLIANVTPNIASIRIPCPPRGPIISSRISGHR